MARFDPMMEWLAGIYVNTLNLIHYMHDKYFYEAAELALIDTDVRRTFATGIAGFSHVVDSLCAIKYAKVKPIRNDKGVAVDFEVEGDFPHYGNDDERADELAVWLLRTFIEKVRHYPTYRHSEPTTSILTITSNVVYGKATGRFPTAERRANRSRPARTRATARKRTAFSRPSTPSRSFPTSTRSTASPTPRRSVPTRSAIRSTNAPKTWSP